AESQGGGDGETVHQQAPHRQGVFVGVAQARETAVDGVGAAAQVPAGEDAGEVVTELTPDGLIESHEVTYLCESFGTACLAAGGSGGVGWEEIEDDEGDCADGEQHPSHAKSPARQVDDHCRPPWGSRMSRSPSPSTVKARTARKRKALGTRKYIGSVS